MNNYLEINKQSWDTRLQAHLTSEFYNLPGFIAGKTSLNDIELGLMGPANNRSVLHLQCHFGQDTISLSRLGFDATGVDFSDLSIQKAKELASMMKTSTKFICSDVYNLVNVHFKKYDVVFTTYGTIPWLPDIDNWAKLISHFLKPNGKLVFVEFHPAIWMYDEKAENIIYSYNNCGPIIEEETGTYADKQADIQQKCVTWNHGLGEVFNSLVNSGLSVQEIREYDYSPYPFISGMEAFEPNKFRIKRFGNKFPLVYSLVANKNV